MKRKIERQTLPLCPIIECTLWIETAFSDFGVFVKKLFFAFAGHAFNYGRKRKYTLYIVNIASRHGRDKRSSHPRKTSSPLSFRYIFWHFSFISASFVWNQSVSNQVNKFDLYSRFFCGVSMISCLIMASSLSDRCLVIISITSHWSSRL